MERGTRTVLHHVRGRGQCRTAAVGINPCQGHGLGQSVGSERPNDPKLLAPCYVANRKANGALGVAFPGWYQSVNCQLGNVLRLGVPRHWSLFDADGEFCKGRSGAKVLVTPFGKEQIAIDLLDNFPCALIPISWVMKVLSSQRVHTGENV